MISVIVPIYNEEKILSKNLFYFQKLAQKAELIFVDGGSLDNSREIANSTAGSTTSILTLPWGLLWAAVRAVRARYPIVSSTRPDVAPQLIGMLGASPCGIERPVLSLVGKEDECRN